MARKTAATHDKALDAFLAAKAEIDQLLAELAALSADHFLADRVLVLPKDNGAAPRLIDIDLPRPRDRSESRFVAMRKRLMAEFGLH